MVCTLQLWSSLNILEYTLYCALWLKISYAVKFGANRLILYAVFFLYLVSIAVTNVNVLR